MLASCIVAEVVAIALVMLFGVAGLGPGLRARPIFFVDKGRSICPYVLGLVCQHGCSQTKATGQVLRSLYALTSPRRGFLLLLRAAACFASAQPPYHLCVDLVLSFFRVLVRPILVVRV